MLNKDYVYKSLEAFAKCVIQQSRYNLTRSKKNASKSLYDSLDYKITMYKSGGFTLELYFNDYGEFQDKGVNGVKVNYGSPFSFKNKKPPIKPLLNWIKQRGIKGRNKKGKFISNRSLAFALSNHIYNNGIKPSLFFTKAFTGKFDKLPEDIVKEYNLAIDKFLSSSITPL